jgi:large subunit ribosomal protein L3
MPHRIKKPQIGHLLKHNLPAKEVLGEFAVTPENFLPIGYMLGPRHVKIGQYVDTTSMSKGKGMQGTIKRWGFSMQNASHGVSRTHRAPGSIGMCEHPGKIFKGRKMSGHMGNQSATSLNQKVVKIDTDRSLIYI